MACHPKYHSSEEFLPSSPSHPKVLQYQMVYTLSFSSTLLYIWTSTASSSVLALFTECSLAPGTSITVLLIPILNMRRGSIHTSENIHKLFAYTSSSIVKQYMLCLKCFAFHFHECFTIISLNPTDTEFWPRMSVYKSAIHWFRKRKPHPPKHEWKKPLGKQYYDWALISQFQVWRSLPDTIQ